MGYFKEVTKNFWSTKDPDHKPFAFTCAAVNSIYRCQRLPMRMVAWFFLFVLLLSPASFTTTIASYCSDQKDCISCVSFEDDTSFPGYGCIWCTPRDQTWPEAPYCMSEYQQDYCKSDIISPTLPSYWDVSWQLYSALAGGVGSASKRRFDIFPRILAATVTSNG